MASSNRHWPSMFKSKPTFNTTHQDHQWHSSATNRSSPYSSGSEERTPEPKPRWNPKPEQIRILESIFNSGLVNPPRDEIRRIRARLQEYGQVGDANVFYWFQNRKSRSKHKNRLQKPQNQQPRTEYVVTAKAVTTSSSSSDDKSSSKSLEFFLNSPTVSVNQQPQTYLGAGGRTGSSSSSSHHQHHGEFFQEPFFFSVVQQKPQAPTASSFTQGFCFSELGTMIDQENHHGNDGHAVVSSSSVLLTDLMMNHQYGIPTKNCGGKEVEEESIMKMLSHNNTPPPQAPLAAPTLIVPPTTTTNIVPSTITDLLQGGTGKAIVFINDVPFEVAVGPFNVKEAFGGDAVLIDSSGQTVLTNEWGVTLQSLEHGAFYYLVRSFAYDHVGTVDLI